MQFRHAAGGFSRRALVGADAHQRRSAFFVGQAVARRMIPRGRGKIINIASVQSEPRPPGIAPYTATKGAIKQLTRGMCADWARHGIQVNAIAPGYFRTELNRALVENPRLLRLARDQDPAGAGATWRSWSVRRLFLASDGLVLRQRPQPSTSTAASPPACDDGGRPQASRRRRSRRTTGRDRTGRAGRRAQRRCHFSGVNASLAFAGRSTVFDSPI